MKPIGGYFSLELPRGRSFHPNALALNTGRNCLEYILRCRKYRKVYVPYYTCGVVMEPFQKLGVAYKYYHINQQLELAEEITLKDDEALLYTNYFGLKQSYVEQLAKRYGKRWWQPSIRASTRAGFRPVLLRPDRPWSSCVRLTYWPQAHVHVW